MVDDKYWQLLKRSLADQHRQYLEDVTIPMNTYFDAPEEFVTTKPSIYHSLRMQPATDARTGKVRSKPAKARALANMENIDFQNSMQNFSLPLSTNQGESLYGRHVYPSELYSLNPNFNLKTTPDLPTSYKMTHGAGDLYRPLNLYGFTGNAPTPQRFTDKTLQPEGILYGDLDENDVVQLNTKPTTAYSLAQVARAISPFHETMDVTRLGENQQELAGDIMEAGIPPILAESNVDTRGRTHHLPFRLDEISDVQEAHDPFAQYDMANLNQSTPEGLEQFTREGENTFPVSSLRTGKIMDVAEQKNASEPMDLSWRLLKEEIPYGSRDYPPQEIAVSTGTPLMGSKNSGPTPEVCNMPGCESGLPPVIYRRMANPIRSIDNHEFMCEQCAYKNDMQSLLYHKMLKGEITLTDYTMQILKNQFKLNEDFTSLRDEAHEGKKENWDGRGRWNEMKKPIYEEYGDEPIPGASWKKPFDLEGFDPKDKSKDFDESGAALPLHFYNQLKRIPMLNQPTAKRILQMALNTGQGMADGSVDKPYELSDFVDFNNIQTSEPMEIAMRLLKEEPLYLQGSNTLARRASKELETDMTGQNSPAYQEMLERLEDIYEPQDGSISLEDNLDQYAQETGINPWRSLPGREMPNKHGGTAKVHLAPLTPIHTQPFYQWQAKNASEPMEIAMRLLKRELSEMTDYEIDRERFANDNTELQNEERTRAMDRMAEFARQNVTPFDYGSEVEEAYDEIGDQDHSDYFGEDIDPNELYQYILENVGEEAAQNYIQQYKDARAKYGGNAATMSQLDNYEINNQGDVNDFIESRENMTDDMKNIMPDDETIFDSFPYPEGVVYNNKLSPPFTTTPQNESNFQMKYTSEPMDIAMRLLKRELHPGENQYKHRYKMPNHDDVHPEWYDWIQETLDDPAEYEGIADDFQQPDINHLAGATSREDFFERLYDLHNFQVDDARPPFDDIEGKYRDFTDIPFSEETGFTRSEPMEIAMQLLKERVSPEAKQHKLEYDKKYESSPERVKYREELNRERRRRHIMGQGGPDMSHTKDHTIVPEDSHTNRARHFKDKGTLL